MDVRDLRGCMGSPKGDVRGLGQNLTNSYLTTQGRIWQPQMNKALDRCERTGGTATFVEH